MLTAWAQQQQHRQESHPAWCTDQDPRQAHPCSGDCAALSPDPGILVYVVGAGLGHGRGRDPASKTDV